MEVNLELDSWMTLVVDVGMFDEAMVIPDVLNIFLETDDMFLVDFLLCYFPHGIVYAFAEISLFFFMK